MCIDTHQICKMGMTVSERRARLIFMIDLVSAKKIDIQSTQNKSASKEEFQQRKKPFSKKTESYKLSFYTFYYYLFHRFSQPLQSHFTSWFFLYWASCGSSENTMLRMESWSGYWRMSCLFQLLLMLPPSIQAKVLSLFIYACFSK